MEHLTKRLSPDLAIRLKAQILPFVPYGPKDAQGRGDGGKKAHHEFFPVQIIHPAIT
ncbi:MAG: hypothetical protein K2P18_01770 [Oscillospiraceae bacterium]|jgi:hypothetical protein|nr:hypothetical protein [Oscillospiraceae bacterium]